MNELAEILFVSISMPQVAKGDATTALIHACTATLSPRWIPPVSPLHSFLSTTSFASQQPHSNL